MTTLIFYGGSGNPVCLEGQTFSVVPAKDRSYEEPPTTTITKGFGPFKRAKTVRGEGGGWQTTIVPNTLEITGGAFVEGYEKSYQETYRAPNLSFNNYADAMTKPQNGVVDLRPVQEANRAQIVAATNG